MSLNFKLQSFNPAKEYAGFHFFVLNKGLNSGRPMNEPCPNCFVCELETSTEKENLYWIFYALWQGKRFEQLLVGSVIPFIRIKETQNLIKESISKNKLGPEAFEKAVLILKTIHEKDLHFQDMAKTLRTLKITLVRDLMK